MWKLLLKNVGPAIIGPLVDAVVAYFKEEMSDDYKEMREKLDKYKDPKRESSEESGG